jgi:hypothetical protein
MSRREDEALAALAAGASGYCNGHAAAGSAAAGGHGRRKRRLWVGQG